VILVVLALIGVGFLVALPMTAVMRAIGVRAGALDSPGAAGHAKALRRVPNTGGVAIFVAVAAPMAIGLAVVWIIAPETLGRWVPALEPHLPRLAETTQTAAAVLVCLAVLHVMGIIDDRRSLDALPKLVVQIVAAAVLATWFDVRLLSLLDDATRLGPVPSILVTVAWIVVVTNAINFIDNMDGLAGGVSLVAASLFMVATIVNQQWFIASTLALLAGALAAFLVFNFPPASIFMGDGGSLVVGFLLAVLTVRTTYFDASQADFALGGGWYGVFMPIVVLAIPIYDCVSVTLIRLAQGRSPFVGDQQHFSHRLVQRGLSPRGAVIVIWALTAVTGIGGISLGRLEGWQAVLVGVQTLLVLLVLALLEHASRRAVRGGDPA
jgi:UDP-GlcNAc:undecaprenyl-phosphate GlcNAc-1-phosphate transferase